MTTLIIGGNGNMGRRYAAILRYLKKDYRIIDVHNMDSYPEFACICDNYIIATPTETHLEYLDNLLPFCKPVLCEKPLTKNTFGLIDLLKDYDLENLNLHMVSNYSYAYHLCGGDEYIPVENDYDIPGLTSYNYYNSGNDGMLWDCIQLMGLAKGPISLKNDSPFWETKINGVPIKREEIDRSYVLMIADFVGGFMTPTVPNLIDLHLDVENKNGEYGQSYQREYWHPGEDYE